MKLLVMRHGEAVAPVAHPAAGADAARELTAAGRAEAVAAGTWLQQQYGALDLVLVSPYIRAQQTWEAVQQQVAAEVVEETADITPAGDPDSFATELLARLQIEPAETVLVISHMPFVSYLVQFLDTTVQAPIFPTAGIAELTAEPLAMSGRLLHLHTVHPEPPHPGI